MGVVHQMLKPDGLFLLHTIGNCEETKVVDPWIEKYIFRNSMAPAMSQLSDAAEGRFVIEDWENYGHHYVPTLQAWYERFNANWERIRALPTTRPFDERFRRLWNYYLMSCKAAFDVETAAPVAARHDAAQFRSRRVPARDAHGRPRPARCCPARAAEEGARRRLKRRSLRELELQDLRRGRSRAGRAPRRGPPQTTRSAARPALPAARSPARTSSCTVEAAGAVRFEPGDHAAEVPEHVVARDLRRLQAAVHVSAGDRESEVVAVLRDGIDEVLRSGSRVAGSKQCAPSRMFQP